MITTVRSEWWMIVLRGAVAAVFGVVALAWPFETAAALVMLIALFVLVDGVFALVVSVSTRRPTWGLGAFEGILGVVIGILALAMPRVTTLVVAFLVGAWALATGVLELSAAIRLRREHGSFWLLGISGALSILLGLAIVISPGAGVAALTIFVGVFALLSGVAIVVYGLRLRDSPSTTV
ncbi:MAG: HdeD family acid-resistance protein [Spirochaetota bacterium]